MSILLAPDRHQIERELDKLLTGRSQSRVLGIRSPVRRTWPEAIDRGEVRFRLAWCESELELRERLDEADIGPDQGLVLITPLDDSRIADDVRARLHHGRLARTDRWGLLRAAFKVRDIDSRLAAQPWMADLLIASVPVGGSYPPAAGATLDLETAWAAAQEHVLRLPAGSADLVSLILWSLDGLGPARLAALPEEAKGGVVERLAAGAGPGARLVLSAAQAGRSADVLAIGLACGVVFSGGPPELREAAVRLEVLMGGGEIAPAAGQALAGAAQRVLTRLIATDSAMARAIQDRAVALLVEVRAESAAGLSPSLDLGLEMRMRDAAAALVTAAEPGRVDEAQRAWRLARDVEDHDRAEDQRPRVNRLVMAARLACWLTVAPTSESSGFAEIAAGYVGDSGFADRARQAMKPGDPIPEVAGAYTRLRDVATARRERENRTFAAALNGWNQGGATDADPAPIESLLERLVAPLARQAPVLLIVLDGLSFPTWLDLAESLPRLGWTELRPVEGPALTSAAAVLPTVTEVSRASLLSGRLVRGQQATEREGFSRHPALLAASRAGRPPRLFHKADLGSGPELASAIAEAVADPQQKVVGLVHNAVDAQLAGSDQIELSWSAEGLRQVSALLRLARDAGRLVVVTGDHGHIVEDGTVLSAGDGGDRWRSAGRAHDGEILLSGERVVSPDGGRAIIAAWSERIRHGGRRGGYHGGASPQEVLVPVAVLASGDPPSGWDIAPPKEPRWWRGALGSDEVDAPAHQARPEGITTGGRRREESRQADLFSPPPPPMMGPQRRAAVLDALRRGAVPREGLDAFAIGMDRFEPGVDPDLEAASLGRGAFKAVRGEYGSGKTFFARWLQERARAAGFATAEIQISETETPLHRWEAVYRRLVERLSTADTPDGALRPTVDAWFYTLEEDVLADGRIAAGDAGALAGATESLMELRLSQIARTAPAFSAVLRAYRRALVAEDNALAEGLMAWLGGQPNVAASVKRAAGIKGDLDPFGAMHFLAGLLVILRDSGRSGLVLVLDEAETLQRMRADTREKGLNALRQLLDELDAGRYPGLYLVVTGTAAFFEGPQGVQRLPPLAQRLHTDFATDVRFDNPRAVQIRLPGFDLPALEAVGRRVRDLFADQAANPDRVRTVVDDRYLADLARGVAGRLGGKAGVAPRLYLRKLVADILDRVDQFAEFDPRRHYAPTLDPQEMSAQERAAAGAESVDDIKLDA